VVIFVDRRILMYIYVDLRRYLCRVANNKKRATKTASWRGTV